MNYIHTRLGDTAVNTIFIFHESKYHMPYVYTFRQRFS